MEPLHSDALVFFGATGDLAYKKIFPSLHALVRRGMLNVPIIGVAKQGWGLEQLRARARESVARHGDANDAAFEKLSRLLRYVDGDYTSASARALAEKKGRKKKAKVRPEDIPALVEKLREEMQAHAKNMEFEEAAKVRDEIKALEEQALAM